MIELNKLESIKISNLLNLKLTIDLALKKQFTVITGYNGSGKSTLLESIFSAFKSLKSESTQTDDFFSNPNYGWGAEIKYEDDLKFRYFDFASPSNSTTIEDSKATQIEIHNLMQNSFNEELYEAQSKLQKKFTDMFQDSIKNNFILKNKLDNVEKRSSRSVFSMVNIEIDDDRVNFSDISEAILFKSGAFFYSKASEIEEKLKDKEIFIKEVSLDKTLFILISELSVLNNTLSNTLNENNLNHLKEKIKTIISKNKKQSNTIDQIVSSLIKSANDDFERFLDISNRFFKKTGRTLRFNESGIIDVILKDGKTIEWIDFSKGEKTLLCLLINVFLSTNKEKLFLLDEPDQALHIEWQKMLLPNLKELAPKCKFIVATHSPSLIGNVNEQYYNMNKLTGL